MNKSKFQPRAKCSSLSLLPNACHFYTEFLEGFSQSNRHKANMINLEDNAHNGKVSVKGRKRLECALQWLLYYAKPKRVSCSELQKSFTFKINFCTLTLPAAQVHSDTEITSRCLSNFFDVWKKQGGLGEYIWRAEAQANGNIHYHIVTDTYIHYNTLRRWWNQSVELLGYVSAFELKFHHRNPNSTDIHSVKHVNKLSSYLAKYMTKERAFVCIGELRLIKGEQVEVLYGSKLYRSEPANKKTGKVIGHVLGGRVRLITSKLWSCSRGLSKMKALKISGSEYRFAAVSDLISQVDSKVYQSDFVRSYYGDFSAVVGKVLVNDLDDNLPF